MDVINNKITKIAALFLDMSIREKNNTIITLVQAKKKSSSSASLSSHHIGSTSTKTTKSTTPAAVTAKLNKLEHIPDTTNFQAVSQNLIAAATNDNAITNLFEVHSMALSKR
ncbi:MAG TPA: hypothetical protein VFJ51_06770 [Nitrososphaeraceae archaeon]|nr:hypothetical protein [Nitrososphaeraceae archaeon]